MHADEAVGESSVAPGVSVAGGPSPGASLGAGETNADDDVVMFGLSVNNPLDSKSYYFRH